MEVLEIVKSYINIAWEVICTPIYIGELKFSFGGFFILGIALYIIVVMLSAWINGGD